MTTKGNVYHGLGMKKAVRDNRGTIWQNLNMYNGSGNKIFSTLIFQFFWLFKRVFILFTHTKTCKVNDYNLLWNSAGKYMFQ